MSIDSYFLTAIWVLKKFITSTSPNMQFFPSHKNGTPMIFTSKPQVWALSDNIFMFSGLPYTFNLTNATFSSTLLSLIKLSTFSQWSQLS